MMHNREEPSCGRLTIAEHLRATWPAVLTLLAGVAASIVFYRVLQTGDEQAATSVFGERAKTYVRAVEKVLDANINAVHWAAATLENTTATGDDDFRRHLAAFSGGYSNTLTLMWAPAVAPEDTTAFESRVRHLYPGLTLRATPGEHLLYPAGVVEPLEGHEELLGYDWASDPEAKQYLDFARDSGKTFVISNCAYIKKILGPTAVLMVRAVGVNPPPSAPPTGEVPAAKGYVLGAFRIDKAVDVALALLNQKQVNLHVFDKIAPPGSMAIYTRMAESAGTDQEPVSEDNMLLLERMNYIGELDLASTRRWGFVCTPTSAHLAEAYTWQPLLGLLAGLSLTAVVFQHFLSQIQQRRKAEALVQRRTAELQRTNERLSTEIAARKQFEAEREELLDLLAQSNESLQRLNERLAISNSDLQDFAVVTSHDLKEPLRKVRVLAGNLRQLLGAASPERAHEYIELIESCAERMHRLITNILQVSRVTTHGSPFTRVDLSQVARDVVDDLAVRIQETGGTVNLDPLPAVSADPMQMRQLLQNLIDNGLKYGSNGTPPRVHVFANGSSQTDRCEICVQDEGPGIAPEDAERIFALFQRVSEDTAEEGSGVGLAVCRKIAERHGGSIRVEPADTRGTRFTVVLPSASTLDACSKHDSDVEAAVGS
ncbi:MAG: CHASE domain-containing protein [Candidatus Hydrogenedentes bacterium]|nr:CHASE domain-containing protein [Candidatus Hydrogenedentota bacterium]